MSDLEDIEDMLPADEDFSEIEDIADDLIDEETEDIEDIEDILTDEDEIDATDETEEDLTEDETEEIEDILTDEDEIDATDNIEDILAEDSSESEIVPKEPSAEEPDEEKSPMEELKKASAKSTGETQEPFENLKTMSKRIIDGEDVELGIDVKTEIGELLKLIIQTKQRVDGIEPAIATSNEHLPKVLNALESVTETTEDATVSLMESADSLSTYYQDFISELEDLEDLLYKKDKQAIIKKLEKMEAGISEADNLGYNILHALEFQDITEQKINKVIDTVKDIGARLGAMLGFIKLKQEQAPDAVSDASQEDIDKLLSEFGLD